MATAFQTKGSSSYPQHLKWLSLQDSPVHTDSGHHRCTRHLVAVVQGGDDAAQRTAKDPMPTARPLVDEEGHDGHMDHVGHRQVTDVHVRHRLLHCPAHHNKTLAGSMPLRWFMFEFNSLNSDFSLICCQKSDNSQQTHGDIMHCLILKFVVYVWM